MWDESRTWLCLVLFLSCTIFEQNKNMYTFLGIKETVMIIYHIILVHSELNMQEWVSI